MFMHSIIKYDTRCRGTFQQAEKIQSDTVRAVAAVGAKGATPQASNFVSKQRILYYERVTSVILLI